MADHSPGGAIIKPRLRTLAGAEPISREGVLAVGEAIGTTLALTGEGIRTARYARLLVGVMAETVTPGRALSLRGLLSSLLG